MEIYKMTGKHIISEIYDPFLLKGMDVALRRIVKAINEREKIVLYGHQDIDGITAVSLLMLVLKYLNADVEYVIPDETKEYYDINSSIIENQIKFLGAKLIITVGCGSNSLKEIELCKTLGMDIIITDFSKCGNVLPDTVMINPKQKGCRYPFKELSAVGVAYKLSQAISFYYQTKTVRKYLDLVMIGTIVSGVPIVGENKEIVNEGIYHFTYTNNYGLKAVMKWYGIKKPNVENLRSLFKSIVPQNSSTLKSVNNARIVVELFTTSNSDRAEQIAKYFLSQGSKIEDLEV